MKITEQDLLKIAEDFLCRLGEGRENARIAAGALVTADLRGINTHGVNLLRLIYERVEAKMLELPTKTEVVRDDGSTAILDGRNGLGQVSVFRGMNLCVDKAKRHGLGMVNLRHINNLGSLGYFTARAAREGVAAVLMTNGNPSVAPYGSAEPFLGTNPISFAFSAGDGWPVVLDMSSSVVARGKIRLASLSNESIPLGWALDENGEPTEDPKRALKGCLLPLGGPKGSGLAMIVDIFSGLLSGSSYGRKLKSFHELDGATGVGACCLAIDVGRFMEPAVFAGLMTAYVAEVRGLRKQPGMDRILLPGEAEFLKEEAARKQGVEVPDQVAKILNGMLAKLGSPLALTGTAETGSGRQ